MLFSFDPQRLQNAVAQGAIGGLGRQVEIRRAALGADLLLVGAAELAFSELLAAPAAAGVQAPAGTPAGTAAAGA